MDVSFDHPNVQLIPTVTENGCPENTKNDIIESEIVNTNANIVDIVLSKNVTSDINQMSSLNKEMSVSSQKDSSSAVKEIKGDDGVRPLVCTNENSIPAKQIIPEIENSKKVTNSPKTDVVIEQVDTVVTDAINDNSKYGDDKKLTGSNEVNSLSYGTAACPETNISVLNNDCNNKGDSNKDHTEQGMSAVKSHPILSSIAEGEMSESRSRTSLPLKVVKLEERNTGKRRNTNPSIKVPNKNAQPLVAKDVDIRRIMSNERQSTRSGFGSTGDADGTKPSLTPPERLKLQLKSGKKPHPLIILPDNGYFWCDPPQSNMSKPKYFLSCFDMEKQWREMYGDNVDIVVNPSETAADTYVSNFSQVIISHNLYDLSMAKLLSYSILHFLYSQ